MKQASEYAMLEASGNMTADLPDNQHDLDRMKGETAILDLPEVKDIPGQEHIKVMPLGELADTTISSSDEEGAGILDFDEGPVGLGDEDDEIGADGDNSVVIAAGGDEDLDEDEDESADADIINDDAGEDFEDDDFITEDDEDDFDEETDVDIDEDEEDVDEEFPRAGLQQPVASGNTITEYFDESSEQDEETAGAEISEEEIALLDNSGPVEPGSDTDNLNRSKLDQEDFEGERLNEAGSPQNADSNELDVPGAEMDDANEKIGEEDEENNVYSEADTDT